MICLSFLNDINGNMNKLTRLYADIDARVNTIREGNTDWQCKMGCDGCCHRLAEIPRLTRTEWDFLQTGLSALPIEIRQEIIQAVTELSEQSTQFVVCPMLDKSKGACRVYECRPVACRTFGYYVQHDKGLYCNDILECVTSGALNEVVWGNQNIIDRQLSSFGDTKDLTEWFAHWKEVTP
jgi:Fe-S-cluster containining protein